MNKKNGFTLIELLVAVAIMLSILGIAIVSFITVSNRKKKEAWQNVKGQIETAADNYVSENAYKYELLDEGDKAYLSVGTLVKEDYLNKVVNPQTGKAVSQCMVVEITKKDGIIESNINSETENSDKTDCDKSFIGAYIPSGGPKITDIEKKCGNNPINDTWCNISISKNNGGNGKSNFKAIADTNGNGSIKQKNGYGYHITTSLNPTIEDISGYSYTMQDSNSASSGESTNSNGKSICFKVVNINDVASYYCKKFMADFELPKGSVTVNSNVTGYNSNNVKLSGSINDDYSGLKSLSFKPNSFTKTFSSGSKSVSLSNLTGNITGSLDGSTKKVQITAIDVAGNEAPINSNDYLVYEECKNNVTTTSTPGSWSACKGTCGTGNKTREITDSKKDNITGKVCSGGSTRTESEACELAACVDLKCPTFEAEGAKLGSGGWYIKNTTCKDYNNNDQNFCVKVTFPSNSGVEKWKWYTNSDRTNVNSTLTYRSEHKLGNKNIGLNDGYRKFKVVVYDKYNNSKECTGTYNIDTTPPNITLRSAAVEHIVDEYATGNSSYISKNKVQVKNNTTVTFGKVAYGATYFCAKKGIVETKKYGPKTSPVSYTNTCETASDYDTPTDPSPGSGVNLSSLKLYDIALTSNNTFNYNESSEGGAGNPYPFPTRFCIEIKDNGGNLQTSCINSIRYYDNKQKSSDFRGWPSGKNPITDKSYQNKVWNSSCWNEGYNKASECFKNLK